MSSLINTFYSKERQRFFLWFPVGIGIGIVFYFSLSFEPTFYWGLSFFVSVLVLCLFFRANLLMRLISLFSLAIALGFLACQIRTLSLQTPMIHKNMKNVLLTGTLVEIEHKPASVRLILDDLCIPSLKKVRLTCYEECQSFQIGDRLEVRADLFPVSEPVSPISFDFRRQAFFQGISASGVIHQVLKKEQQQETPYLFLNYVRHLLSTKIRHFLVYSFDPSIKEIAVALITGERTGISQEVRQAFVDAGIAHILAISGLHLSLLAGIVFLIFRRFLTFVPVIGGSSLTKKIAAVSVIVITGLYLIISGMGVPAQRAFIMVGLSMVAVLCDRWPFSMRLVAIAAIVILLLTPESLLSASFQLSFSAVIALIAVYERGFFPFQRWLKEENGLKRFVKQGLVGILNINLTTLVATTATTILTIYLFNRFTLQAILGNLLSIPLVGFWIMPWAFIATVSLMWGGNEWIFFLFGLGVNLLKNIALYVASLPGSVFLVPTPSKWFLFFTVFGGLWLCLWQSFIRYSGIIFVFLGFIFLGYRQKPTILMAGDSSVIGYIQGESLYLSSLKKGRFYVDTWIREYGLTQKQEWESFSMTLPDLNITLIRFPFDRKAVKKICQTSTIVLSNGYLKRLCQQCVIDKNDLKRLGSLAFYQEGADFKVVYVRTDNRPWGIKVE
ncbi:MAG: ComEC family competence protein [Proteobacteria bacterium]|nr:ComEC family competence protein [Pseudomonadota bacterium]